MLFRLMYCLYFYYFSSEESGVTFSLVSLSYDPALAMHAMVMIAGFDIGLIFHDPIHAVTWEWILPDTFIIS